jgi:hypothetical protein
MRSAGRRQFSAKYKAKILAEYDALVRGKKRGISNRRQRGELWTLQSLQTHRGKSSPRALGREALSIRSPARPKDRWKIRTTSSKGGIGQGSVREMKFSPEAHS